MVRSAASTCSAQEEFESLHNKIRQAPVTSKQARDFLRLFLSGANQETPDKQRRVTIPANLREYAGSGVT